MSKKNILFAVCTALSIVSCQQMQTRKADKNMEDQNSQDRRKQMQQDNQQGGGCCSSGSKSVAPESTLPQSGEKL